MSSVVVLGRDTSRQCDGVRLHDDISVHQQEFMILLLDQNFVEVERCLIGYARAGALAPTLSKNWRSSLPTSAGCSQGEKCPACGIIFKSLPAMFRRITSASGGPVRISSSPATS